MRENVERPDSSQGGHWTHPLLVDRNKATPTSSGPDIDIDE